MNRREFLIGSGALGVSALFPSFLFAKQKESGRFLVFQNLDLTVYGNRLPNLSVKLVSDEGLVYKDFGCNIVYCSKIKESRELIGGEYIYKYYADVTWLIPVSDDSKFSIQNVYADGLDITNKEHFYNAARLT